MFPWRENTRIDDFLDCQPLACSAIFSKADTSLLACDKVSIVGSKEILFMAA
jgi:hypothetical protein